MYRILCFGDSNTWGYDPETGDRFDHHTRWPRHMAGLLGSGFEVIEEGMNGRTTVWDDVVEDHMSGLRYLTPCLRSHKPLELVLIMLGTNDLKDRFNVTAFEIAKSVERLVQVIKASATGPGQQAPAVLLIAPPPLVDSPGGGNPGFSPRCQGMEKSRAFACCYAARATESGCYFFDAGSVIATSPVDGVHLSAESHRILGAALAAQVRLIRHSTAKRH
ncbi:MAG TPA: SGNH/GDSL hydrolase family protein [Thiolinea sp.]|nr:SGNH/GDSL hydrolase family protein [Thiolinea sp.]